jgi:3-oxoacyl-[acyl-carrier-protein] synthase II
VTGLGIVAPVGNTVEASWANVLAGKSGIGPITHFEASEMPVRFCGAIKDFDVTEYISRKDARKMDPFIHYGMAAAIQAIDDAGLEIDDGNAQRVGISIGSGIGGLPGIEEGYHSYLNGGARKITPFFVPRSIINMISGNLSIRYGIRGPNIALVSACATGTHSIGTAARMISQGDVDVMVAGGAEMASTPTGIGGFASARALSTRNDEPEKASRPWDKQRDGFVLSDGAGVLVLESLEYARSRGAEFFAELVGFGMNSDAYHMTLPAPGGEGATQCMQMALRDAGLNPEEVDYINAHGTSTPAGDLAEADAVKATFGDHAYQLAISSTKSMTGHTLGAAGGVEAVFSLLAMRDRVAPPTINLDEPDDGCDLNFVPHRPEERKIDVALSNSFGFGGTNGTVIFKRLEQ